MIHSAQWLRVLIFDYPSFKYIIIFLGAAFGGEIALFTFAFLAAQKILSPTILVFLSFFANVSSDSMWFFLGRTKIGKKVISHRYTNSAISVVAEAVHRVSRGNHFVALIFAKFLIGTRVVMI